MQIETKYNLGDHFWTMRNNKPQKVEVGKIYVTAWENGRTETVYSMYMGIVWEGDRNEEKLDSEYFRSQELLINSLFK